MASYALGPADQDARDLSDKGKQASRARNSADLGGSTIAPESIPARTSSKLAPTTSEAPGQHDGRKTYDMQNLRSALPATYGVPSNTVKTSARTRGSSLNKPLPSPPPGSILTGERTEDTTVYRKQAPAVTHETIYQDVHEVEHQRITREVHEHDVYHRILPIHDVEVLPPVHYVWDDRGMRQISNDEVPGRHREDTQRIIEEGFKKTLPRDSTEPGRRQFSARHFAGTEGEYKEQTTSDGVKRSETWWVHAPTLATGAKETGQTKPLHLDSSG